jgi:hypothetical protein
MSKFESFKGRNESFIFGSYVTNVGRVVYFKLIIHFSARKLCGNLEINDVSNTQSKINNDYDGIHNVIA